ncbi:MAG TPA: 50S ribosomal protein L17 [Candidatus Avidesulfovibrio excrementigallinarum]|nr:50S ribosomal protein L17 [Candidatus Avidesulfovibrio excrementigallinarum]
MRHNNSGKKLGRTPSHRKALFCNMAKALITYGKIRTTEVKAKELRRVVEPLITLALRNDLHARRLAYQQLGDHAMVKRLFDEVAPVFAGVPGGYTRITRLALPRKGDCAPMAIIELVTPAKQEAAAKAE